MFGQPKEDMRVADYVLGLMQADEARFFERELQRDPALSARVEEWRERIARLEEGDDETPHAKMRRRIEAGIRRRKAEESMSSVVTILPRLNSQAAELPGLVAVGTVCFVTGILLGGALTWLIFT